MGSNPFSDPTCTWGRPPRDGECDPYRFLEPALAELLRANVRYEEVATEIPWAPVSKSNVFLGNFLNKYIIIIIIIIH